MEALTHSGYIGEDRTGWGQKGSARKWLISESGKENNILFPRSHDENMVGRAFNISLVKWYYRPYGLLSYISSTSLNVMSKVIQ